MRPQTPESQSKMTPAEALQRLKDGNGRFTENRLSDRDIAYHIEKTKGGQWPFAAVLTCIDSRVPLEIVFDQSIGDVFGVRIAGNFINVDILGSLEYACKVAGSKLIIVMGHKACGAVSSACDNVEFGNITALLSKIKPAVEGVAEPKDPALRNSKNPEFVHDVTIENIRLATQAIRDGSPTLKAMEEAKEIDIWGAHYDVSTGKVEFLFD